MTSIALNLTFLLCLLRSSSPASITAVYFRTNVGHPSAGSSTGYYGTGTANPAQGAGVGYDMIEPCENLGGGYLLGDGGIVSGYDYNLNGREHWASQQFTITSLDSGKNVLRWLEITTDSPGSGTFTNPDCLGPTDSVTGTVNYLSECQSRVHGGYDRCGLPPAWVQQWKSGGSKEIDLATETGLSIEVGGKVTWHYYAYGRQYKTDLMNHDLDVCEIPAPCPLITYTYEPPTCFNDVKDAGESGVDCGGSTGCVRCVVNQPESTCNGNSDCVYETCCRFAEAGVFGAAPPGNYCQTCDGACFNGEHDFGETGVDCGGTCQNCSLLCSNGHHDGDELGTDCGGSCGVADSSCYTDCTLGEGECLGGQCCGYAENSPIANEVDIFDKTFTLFKDVCKPCSATCNNSQRDVGVDNGESDIDCGGTSTCDRCGEGDTCHLDNDCISGYCCAPTIDGATICQACPSVCFDRIQNNEETDVDCGGAGQCVFLSSSGDNQTVVPPRCWPGKKCEETSDCLSGLTCRTIGGVTGTRCFLPEVAACTAGANGNECENGGVATGTGPNCACDCTTVNFHGDNCEFASVCTAGPGGEDCQNGGGAIGSGDNCLCNCTAVNFAGDNCQTASVCTTGPGGDDCENSGTTTGYGDNCLCDCPSGYEGALCETIKPCEGGANGQPCDNGGVPTGLGYGPTCGCNCDAVNFVSPNCENSDYCETGGVTFAPERGATNPCRNGGTATGGPGIACGCDCPSEYGGEYCETTLAPCTTGQDGGACQHYGFPTGYGSDCGCDCPVAYPGGAHCEYTTTCEDVGAHSQQCLNGGIVVQSADDASCSCDCSAVNFEGDNCETASQCTFGRDGGVCQNAPTEAPTPTPYVPPKLNANTEVLIEGLAKEDFPPDLGYYFDLQHKFFLLVYAVLSFRLLIQVLLEPLKQCFSLNRHFITLFVLLGCLLRSFYIFTTDIYSVALKDVVNVKLYEYGLRAFNDVLWFAAFAYLAFYWYELQIYAMKKHVLNVSETKAQMWWTIGMFVALRFGRFGCETFDMKHGVLITKGGGALYLIGFFVFIQTWGHRLMKRLRTMNKRLSMIPATMPSGSQLHSKSNLGGSGKSISKKGQAIRRFRTFLMGEAIISFIALAEHAASIYLKEKEIISLEYNPGIVLLLKCVQRGTEYIMMLLLAYLVCLKATSRNFTLEYRLPTCSIPVCACVCAGGGQSDWCASAVVKGEDLESSSSSELGSSGHSDTTTSSTDTTPSPSPSPTNPLMRDGPGKGHEKRTSLRSHIQRKKEEKRTSLHTVSSFEKHQKSKKKMGNFKRPSQREIDMELRNYRSASKSVLGMVETQVVKPQPRTLTTATLGSETTTRNTAKSVFEAFNPMSRQAWRAGVDLEEDSEPALGSLGAEGLELGRKKPTATVVKQPRVNKFGKPELGGGGGGGGRPQQPKEAML
ncbi:hypothetical protein TrLO_g8825 [Triparma laevis f. longispina]|uniref:EGF-like domain-containing protein n=1 Tax=Triparma laevis f. longispina TaxID=1714387 RepID=A0A9W7ADW3_9STRA|nr:hypothetical protein TrLO_g8825 [Triparma laevis f. longispina]